MKKIIFIILAMATMAYAANNNDQLVQQALKQGMAGTPYSVFKGYTSVRRLPVSVFQSYTTVRRVPNFLTVNGHALSSNVVVSASDLTTGTLPHAQLPTLVSGDIPNNAANTTGSAAKLADNTHDQWRIF